MGIKYYVFTGTLLYYEIIYRYVMLYQAFMGVSSNYGSIKHLWEFQTFTYSVPENTLYLLFLRTYPLQNNIGLK